MKKFLMLVMLVSFAVPEISFACPDKDEDKDGKKDQVVHVSREVSNDRPFVGYK